MSYLVDLINNAIFKLLYSLTVFADLMYE